MAFDDAVPGEAFADALAGAGEEVLCQRWIGCESFEGVGKRDRIFFGNEDSRFSIDNDIRNSTDIACDNREAEFHGFDEDDSETFGVALAIDNRWEREDVRCAVFVREIFR